MLRVGLSVGNAITDTKALRAIKQARIDAVELAFADYRPFEALDFQTVKKQVSGHDIVLWSMHLPYAWVDPASLDADLRKFSYDQFMTLIRKGTDIGIDKFVVHPSSEPNYEQERAEKLKRAAQFFHDLAEAAAPYGATIAIEDLPRTCLGNCSEEILYLLDANDKLRACFDTNHLLGENVLEFIKKVGNKILTIHVSDYDFLNERHWLPGEGDNDWLGIYSALRDVGYEGVWLYELELKPRDTICRRDLTYADFYSNAEQIMRGETPTAIGKRVEGLTAD